MSVERGLLGRLTVVRPATDADADLLVAWHADPEVSRYWDRETFTRDEVLVRLHRERVDAWIVETGGEPVGYLQSWWEDDPPRRGGLDGFLVPGARGHELMPDAARVLAQSLLDSGWAHVTVDPYVWNESAIRAWVKAGFVEVSRSDEQLLMRFESQVPGT
jgi:RimJ/RimL family protein N-acetyltransferase